ncbi:MAG: putative sulfate exporter family transporter [Tepidisphaera sp.]|nr:putative sulfate exporter family transporter [Tepidisphaera sp.]
MPDQATPDSATPDPKWKQYLFVACAVAAAGPWSRPDVALLAGIVLALINLSAFQAHSKKLSKVLIQVCVVALGFRLDLATLAHSASRGLVLAVSTIAGALIVGLLLGKLLRSGKEVSVLISSGTAICGGSAIAAVGASIGASSSTMAVATGAIFCLNAIGLWVLPWIGHALHMTDLQFGEWAGVALHDIATVTGAAKDYHASLPKTLVALDTANIVKLTRVLWIFPIALAAGRLMGSHSSSPQGSGAQGARKAPFPWFILLFIVASAIRTWIPAAHKLDQTIAVDAAVGFQLALFLIGAGLHRSALAQVGWRALAQATILWIIMASGSCIAILARG